MAGNTRSEKHCSEHVLFGVAEMLEAVLLQLPTTCIFTSQSVCKDFRNTVQTNPQLRQRRFIDLAPDAAHLPLLTSSTLTFLKKRGAHRVDRNVYLDSGRNLCHSVADRLNITLETIQRRGGIQFEPLNILAPDFVESSALQTYISTKPLLIVLTIEVIDCMDELGEAWFNTGTTEPLRIWELLLQADGMVDDCDDWLKQEDSIYGDSENGRESEDEESDTESRDENEDQMEGLDGVLEQSG
ncbi:hypothetical protein LTR02_000793 [Friedmanniomyces endolithicus]|nr:hypothetical protein LTR94_010837 [Friedmanniomyces endolithicus]KAK0812093.1 hypothetical protein LTR59_001569 [Friedmanniomyces endolithicus]KAK0819327.1 hypothetical protein LTR38_000770 [Friedmanniomyces endolithicus]KAK0821848.1 hypothetical protein LTR75_000505 [Friedmanniomyces endolithicus]KAK0847364.1 hypothetical protein LTR03_006341 [Friedmanniomyces endolithicus]